MFSIMFGILASVLPNLIYCWLYNMSSDGLLSKLAVEDGALGDAGRRIGVYTSVHDDSSSASTTQFSSTVEFRKEPNAPNRFIRLFYLSEGIKFGVLALLVSACLLWPNLHVAKFFSAFLLSEITRLLLQFFFLKKEAIK